MADSNCEAPKEPVKKEPTKSEKRRAELITIVDALLRNFSFNEILGAIQDVIEKDEKRKTPLRKRQIRSLRVGAALMEPGNDDKRIFMIRPEKPIVFPPLG